MSQQDLRLQVILQAIDKVTGPLKAVMGSSAKMAGALKEAREQLRHLEQQNKRLDAFRQTARDVAATGNAMQAAQAKVKDFARQMAATDAPSKALLRNFEAAKREAGQLKDRHGQLTQQHQRMRGELQAAGVPLKGMARHQADLRKKIDEATGALHRQEAALKAQGDRMRRLADARARYQRTLDVRNQVAAGGAVVAAAGSGALYAGARLADTGIDFGAAMSRVQALAQLEKASAEFQALRRQARELGATTSFTATQAAEAQGFLAMAGFKSKQIMEAMPGMLNLSKAGGTDLQRTADIASNILSAFGLEASKMPRVGDVLTKAFTSSNVSLENLAETMKYVGPVARAAGMSLEQSAAMAGLLGNIGLQGSMAGTSLRAMMLRLSGPPKAAREALEDLKVSAKDAHGNVRQIPEILFDIAKATDKMGTGTRLSYLKDIFGEEAAAGMSDLLARGGSGELQKYIEILNTAQGTAAKTASIMADNAQGDLLNLQSAWEDLKISLFDTNEAPLRSLIQSITGVLRNVGQWISANPELVGTLVKVGAAVAAVAAGGGAMALAVSSILGPLALLRLSITTLGINGAAALGPGAGIAGRLLGLLNPVSKVIAAFSGGYWIGGFINRGLNAAVSAFVGYETTLGGAVFDLVQNIRATIAGGLGSIGAAILNWSPLGLFYRAFAGVMGYFGIELPGKFTEFGGMLLDGLVRGITGALGRLKDAITGAGGAAVGWFKEKLGIHSPSRVFAQLGSFTMDGFAAGLQGNAKESLQAVMRTVRQLTTAAGLGMAGAGVAVAAGPGITIDERPPLASAPVGGGGQTVMNYTININAAPGTDTNALRAMVRDELERHKRELEARQRSSLADFD